MQIKSLLFGFYIYIYIHVEIIRISLLVAVKYSVKAMVIPGYTKSKHIPLFIMENVFLPFSTNGTAIRI